MLQREITLYVGAAKIQAALDMPLRVAVDMTWDRKDRGGKYVVVERGKHNGLYLTDTGRIIATSNTEFGAKNVAGKAKAYLRRRHLSGQIDIVMRESVEIRSSRAAYGCNSGEG